MIQKSHEKKDIISLQSCDEIDRDSAALHWSSHWLSDILQKSAWSSELQWDSHWFVRSSHNLNNVFTWSSILFFYLKTVFQ